MGGVALAVFLISILLSLYRGWDEKVGGFVEDSDIDVWIGSEGVSSFLAAASILPAAGTEEGDQAAAFFDDNPSVTEWSTLIVRPLEAIRVEVSRDPQALRVEGQKMDVQLIGYDTATGMGGPLRIVKGKGVPGPGELIIDEALGKRYGVKLDDTVNAGGRDWHVAGISSGGDFVAVQTAFVTLEEARSALGMEGLATFYAVRLSEDVDAKQFATDLENIRPEIRAFTGQEFAKATRDRILGEILPILLAVLALAFIVGLSVAGLTIYTATVEKSREYGILKAVGFANAYLYRVVLEQSVVTGCLGFLIGVGLTLIVGPFASDVVPQFVLFTRWQDVLAVAGVTVLMAVIAAYIPVRRLATIDPVAVFKA